MEAQEPVQKRERRLTYYVAQKPVVFKTKKEVENFLTQAGGLKEGEVLVKGVPVEAQKEQVFKIG